MRQHIGQLERLAVGDAALNVVPVQALVEGERRRKGLHRPVRLLPEPAGPGFARGFGRTGLGGYGSACPRFPLAHDAAFLVMGASYVAALVLLPAHDLTWKRKRA